MSCCVPVAGAVDETCANCGKQGGDTVKLRDCAACHLVKYCGVDCQKAHRKQHKKACKQRAAELKDEELYSQGHERAEGDFCPICTLPIPFQMHEHSVLNMCCMKKICNGCDFAAKMRDMEDCPFCRTPYPEIESDADQLAMIQARVEKKDPIAISFLGQKYWHGQLGLQEDARKAVELYTEAAELGSHEGLSALGLFYVIGHGVEQDEAKGVQLWAKGAMQGDVESRYNLGCNEEEKGNHDRAVRHHLISAKTGYGNSVEKIKGMFIRGLATKEQYTQALKGYQDAMTEMKSPEREEAKALGWVLRM
ncbi:hypothetical protein THAOC_17921 [Thalassiosira oceanica]|uniref:MYND-type domain-containing protein n=1 Tax=Thalassiosira oceanica TaxID=159749 RepID=K0S9G9_THAOC|nr:hypothetical protein THAOC_17921 [Thalassiosira oceanica]|eukprot:EJK61569.1 hypothetical protein THAOC_17921 [Thalassiosira oceanica]